MKIISIFMGILLVLILASSLLSMLKMMRANILFEDKMSEAKVAVLTGAQKRKAGKEGILSSYYGVYTIGAKGEGGEFVSLNPYGKQEQLPKEVLVIPMNGGVLERCRIGNHFCRKYFPTWVAVGAFFVFFLQFVK